MMSQWQTKVKKTKTIVHRILLPMMVFVGTEREGDWPLHH